MKDSYDILIIGSGIIGLTLALQIKRREPHQRVLIIDKEADIAYHASSRNSGVLHAGFYYTADSLKAKFTVAGNRAMKDYCREKGLALNESGKLVVAQDESEMQMLYELEQRGKKNGSTVKLVDEGEAAEIDPNAKTFKKALYSPDTASIDPKEVCHAIRADLKKLGVEFSFQTKYLSHKDQILQTTKGDFGGKHIVNCGGLYADKIAQDFGFGHQYTMVPFKGLYLKYTKNKTDVRVNIYPVPNLKNPFLGVHFTKTVTDEIKIGPTAIPAFWRENYQGMANFRVGELVNVLSYEARMFLSNSSHFRDLAREEMRKYRKPYFVDLAARMVKDIDRDGFTEFTEPGIRAQLLDKASLSLVQDFRVEGDAKSTHILNAVSPAFTCAFPFSAYVLEGHLPAERA